MDYRKEQNFMVAYDENNNMRGKWNILTNQYIGVRGAVIKSKPVAFRLDPIHMPTYLYRALEILGECNQYHPFTEAVGQRLEQIISLRLCIEYTYGIIDFLATDKTPLTKDLVRFIEEECNGRYSKVAIQQYQNYKENKGFLDRCGDQKKWAIEALDYLKNSYEDTFPKEFVQGMIIRAIHEKVYYDYAGHAFASLLRNWMNAIDVLGDTLEVKHNILTNYVILRYLENQYKQEHYDDVLKHFNDKAWLHYENENYIVRPLISRKDFHIEAEYQQNCVERMYMDRVYEGRTHVVAVRKKSNPDVPYITCEVRNSGEIWQYLYRFNNHVDDADDRAFAEEYQNHLNTSEK